MSFGSVGGGGGGGGGGATIARFNVSTNGIPANEARFVDIGTTGDASLSLLQQNDGTTQDLSFTFDTEDDWDHDELAQDGYFTGGTGDSIPTKWVLDSGTDGHFTNAADETLTPDNVNVIKGVSVSINSVVKIITKISGSTVSLQSPVASNTTINFIRGTVFFDDAGDKGAKPTGTVIPSTTLLLIHSDSVDGNQDFIDLSSSTRTVTANGDVEHSTDIVDTGFGATMIHGDGTGDFLSVPDSSAWNLAGVDRTFEFRTHIVGDNSNKSFFGHGDESGGFNLNSMEINTDSNTIRWIIRNGSTTFVDINTGVDAIDDGEEAHVAFVKEGNVYSIYAKGNRLATVTETTTPADLGTAFNIGRRSASQPERDFIDYMGEIRVSSVALYSGASYTVPTVPFGFGVPTGRTFVIAPNDAASMASTANLSVVNDFSTKKPDGSTESVTTNGENVYVAIPDTLRQNFSIKEGAGSRIIASDRNAITDNGDGNWSYASDATAAPNQAWTLAVTIGVNTANSAISQAMDNGSHNQMTYITFSALTNTDLLVSAGGDGILMDSGTAGDLTGAAIGFNTDADLPQILNVYFAFDGATSELILTAEEVQRIDGTSEVKIEPATTLTGNIDLLVVK